MAKKQTRNTKGNIITAAWQLFYEQGYDNTTVDEIIAAAKTSKGSFYHYFNGKDALLSTLAYLFDEKYEELMENMEESMNSYEKLLFLNQGSVLGLLRGLLGSSFLFLGLLDGFLLLGLLRLGSGGVGLNGPLGQFHADPVVAGLNHDGVGVHHNDLAHDAADGGDGVALLQAVPHLLGLLFPLVLRADHEEIHHRHEQYDHNDTLFHSSKLLLRFSKSE